MKRVLLPLIVFLLSSQIFAQIEDRITDLPAVDLKSYATPLATFSGSYFNSGGYYDASVAKTFGFKISLIGMMIMIPDEQRTFKLSDGTETATFFGENGAAVPGSFDYAIYPPGINAQSVPAAIPQIGASLFGTELMLRFVPKSDIEDVSLGLFGVAVKHSVSQYIPMSPVDIAVQIMYNNFSVESPNLDISSSNLAFNVHASRSFGVAILYGGLQYESTSMDIDYTFSGTGFEGTSSGDKQNLSLDGDNNFRITLGAALRLAVVVLNADVNFGSQTAFVAGLNFEL